MYRIQPEVPGELGQRTTMDVSVHPPAVERLHLIFTGWLGDDLVESFPCFLASERLRNAIQAAGLSGVVFDEVEVDVDEQMAEFDPHRVEGLPKWYWLRPSTERGADFWQDELANLFLSEAALQVARRFELRHAEVFWTEIAEAN